MASLTCLGMLKVGAVWGYKWIKHLVYTDEITSVEQLRERIVTTFESVKTKVFVLNK